MKTDDVLECWLRNILSYGEAERMAHLIND